uniref:Uncharacterized protein n=1 Tax=Sphaerodactylus townsendi TaxID=933632 RepID=A0ACB8F1W5_9SAUR
MGFCYLPGDGFTQGMGLSTVEQQLSNSSEEDVISVSRRLSLRASFDGSRPHHPPTLTMVLEAVQALEKPKGVSAFAIKRYILHQYPGVDPVRLKYYLKQALVKGISQGYLVRPFKSSAQGASGSFKLGKEKAQQRKGLKKNPDEKPTVKLEGKAAKQPKVKEKSPKQKLKRKGPEQVEKKTSSTKPRVPLGNGGATTSGVEPRPKASGEKAAKATKQQGLPKATKAISASGPKKHPPKTKAELKGVPETKAKIKLLRDEKAKGGSVPKGAIARSRAASEAKTARAKGQAKAKKGTGREQVKKEATAGSEA